MWRDGDASGLYSAFQFALDIFLTPWDVMGFSVTPLSICFGIISLIIVVDVVRAIVR